MTAHVWEHFIEPMTRVFQDPPGNNSEGFFVDLAAELADATVYQLREAASQIKRSRTVRSFPTMAECIAVVRDTPMAPQPPKAPDSDEKDDLWHPARMRFADELLRREPIARQAAEEHWLYPLWDFVRTHRRMPDPREMRKAQERGAHAQRRIVECRAMAEAPRTEAEKPIGGFKPLGAGLDFRGSWAKVADAYEGYERKAVQRVFPRMVREAAE